MPILHGRGRFGVLASTAALAVTLSAAPAWAQAISERDAISAALAQGDFAALGEAEQAAADARVGTIARLENPQLTADREQVSGSGGRETEIHVGVTQPISLSGQRSSLRAAARAEAAAIGADIARRRQERIAATREAYASCTAAREKVAILDGYAARLREAERIVGMRARAGDAAGYDLRRLRLEASSAVAQQRIAEGEERASCLTLSRLTGLATARPARRIGQMLPATPALAASTVGGTSRQDLVARERRVAAASAEADAARRARLPDLEVGVGYKRLSNEDGSASGPTVGLGVRLPLFNRGGAAVTEARARQRQREAELALARREVEAEIAAASARAAGATAAAREALTTAQDAERLGQIAEAAYQGGETGVVELVDAYRTARDARLSVVELAEKAVLATISFNLAEGREP